MPTKIDLKTLAGYYEEMATNQDLPKPIRRAMSLGIVQCAHIARVEKQNIVLSKQLATIADLLLQAQKAAAPQAAAPQAPSAPIEEASAPLPAGHEVFDESLSDEERAEKITADLMRDAEAEAPKAPIPLRKQNPPPPAQNAS